MQLDYCNGCFYFSDFVTLHSIIMDLLGAGAHIDAVNADGKTPAAIGATGKAMSAVVAIHFYNSSNPFRLNMNCYSDTGIAQFILKAQLKPSLKCIAANFVRKYKIPYYGMVPKDLEAFIDLHGICKYSIQLKTLPIVYWCLFG